MVVKRGGLGRNLSALLTTNTSPLTDNAIKGEAVTLSTLAISDIHPGHYQPRRTITEEALEELADSIKRQGILQPLVVRQVTTGYEIIAGERRWRASQMAGLKNIPVIIKQVDDETAMAIALIENLQREELNAIDQALAMERLVNEFALTHQQIADLLCKSRAAVSNYLRLLQLNTEVRRLLEQGHLDMGHARSLLMLDDPQQTQVAHQVVARNLSVRETEALVARFKAEKNPAQDPSPPPTPPFFYEQLHALAAQLQTNIKLKPHSKGRGTLMIHYEDAPHLERLMTQLIG
jgi:ParB family transcriptional regulator, chromosome partitioning protein